MDKRNTSTSLRTSRRRNGQRMNAEERRATQEIFLQAFSMTANIRAACMKAGIDRASVYRWQEHDTEFSIRFKQAELDANDLIRGELFRRAVQGYEKPIVSMGKQVFVEETVNGVTIKKPLMERMYSDNLLSLLAKSRLPEFKDKLEESPLQAIPINTSGMTNEEIATIKKIAIDVKRRQGE